METIFEITTSMQGHAKDTVKSFYISMFSISLRFLFCLRFVFDKKVDTIEVHTAYLLEDAHVVAFSPNPILAQS